MCKCLGCMEGVVLLSELHPHGWKFFNPINQAMEWFGLLTQAEIAELQKQGSITYSQVIELIGQRCMARGHILVLRDWAHLDFTGLPFVTAPPYRPLLYSELAQSFDIIRISTTRDPVTQWQSLVKLEVMRNPLQSGVFNLDKFLVGYRKYAELCVETGFIRYEDFLHNPDLAMRKFCDHLQIKFDSEFISKWPDYKTITGDVPSQSKPSGITMPYDSNKILLPPKRTVEASLKKRFLANADYHRACQLLGYDLLEK